ncbi:MAG: outer membrane lipoprotein carrier protein LolA [Prevotellaceae bacterium]|jgi:chaperone LolA|nr:outer membrane lipoprotein carrier protein LolA [Prevotellaceae bacterium]
MKNKPAIVLIALCCAVLSHDKVGAQTESADKLLGQVINSIEKSVVASDFTLKIKDASTGETYETTGNFLLKGDKFALKTTETEVFFDGKTQWVYFPQIEEVSINEPTKDELNETNPLAILLACKSRCTVKHSAQKAPDALSYYIELHPKKADDHLKSIRLLLDKNSKALKSVSIIEKNGNTTFLKLTNYSQKTTAPDSIFKFDKRNYPGVGINDLR